MYTTRVPIGQKPMGYCVGKLIETAATYNCSIKAIERIFYGFTGVMNLLGMLGDHSKSR